MSTLNLGQPREIREAVRSRPGMYIGSADERGLHHFVTEIAQVSVDQAAAGLCSNIEITLNANGSFLLRNDGPALNVAQNQQLNISNLEIAMTLVWDIASSYAASVKYNSYPELAFSMVNALSEWAWVEVLTKEGQVYQQDYTRGIPQGPVQIVRQEETGKEGNTFCFKPDPEIFETLVFNYGRLADHFRQIAYLTKGLRIQLKDERSDPPQTSLSYFEDGILAYLKELTSDKVVLGSPIYAAGNFQEVQVEVAVQFVSNVNEVVQCFANYNRLSSGGMPVSGFREALTRTYNKFARQHGLLKKDEPNIKGKKLREGLVSIINVKLPHPYWWGPTKSEGIHNPEARAAVRILLSKALMEWQKEHLLTANG